MQYGVGIGRKNQLTLPRQIAAQLDVRPGDRLLFEVDERHAGQARVRVLRRSYSGILAGVYGSPGEAAAYLGAERESWDLPE